MKVFPCLDIANACCLEYTNEAFSNIDLHANQIFSYDEISRELTELIEDYCKYGFAEKVQNEDKVSYKLKENITLAAALDVINCYNGWNLSFKDYGEPET